LAQTYKPLEIIVIDDGSQDNTKDVLNPFIEAQEIRYFYQENQGPGAARNLGVLKSRGDLVAFCDSDDLWLPDKLEKQIRLFQDPEVALVYSDMEILGGNDSGKRFSKVFGVKSFHRGKVFDKLVKGNFIPNSTVVVRRRVIEDAGGFSRDKKFFSVEDYILWLLLAKDHKLDYAPEILVQYRMHDSNISLQDKKTAYQRLADVYAYLISKYGLRPSVLWKYLEYKAKIFLWS
jgi:glycosyltransferase involved in cell wall biosynthesis